MYRNLLFILIFGIFLSACVDKKTIVVYKDYKEQKSNEFDSRLMQALTYSHFNEYEQARDEFLALFKDYNVTSFLENAYFLTLANNLDKASELDNLAKPYLNQNDNLKRLSVLYSLQNFNLARAEKLAKELLAKKSNDPRDLELYADVLVAKNEPKNAIKYYRLAYKHFQNEDLLFKIIGLYASFNDAKNIKILLENFKKTNGCTLKTCLLLAQIYNGERNIKALKDIYISLYETSHNKDFILALIELLNLQNQKEEALQLALKYDVKDDVKIFLYQSLNQFEEAKKLTLKMYEQDKDKKYLLRLAVIEFEEANFKNQLNPEKISQIAKKFEEGIDENSEPLYLNYYGYLLIDYDLDVKKGMRLVELALEKEPNNFYYIDSLAWGYYKLGDCQKAWELLKQTFSDEEFSNSQESKTHIKAIKECLSQ